MNGGPLSNKVLCCLAFMDNRHSTSFPPWQRWNTYFLFEIFLFRLILGQLCFGEFTLTGVILLNSLFYPGLKLSSRKLTLFLNLGWKKIAVVKLSSCGIIFFFSFCCMFMCGGAQIIRKCNSKVWPVLTPPAILLLGMTEREHGSLLGDWHGY